METTADCKHGFITSADVYPANEKRAFTGLAAPGTTDSIWGSDAKYCVRPWLRYRCHSSWSGVSGHYRIYSRCSVFHFLREIRLLLSASRRCVLLPGRYQLVCQRLNCSRPTGKYLRCYQVQGDTYKHCKRNSICFKQAGIRRRILGSSCILLPIENKRVRTYWQRCSLTMTCLRKIWADGLLSVLKREHCLSKVRKRGIPAVTEECLLSARALNLKRMVRAIYFFSYMLVIWAESIGSQPRFVFCQQVHSLTPVDRQASFHRGIIDEG